LALALSLLAVLPAAAQSVNSDSKIVYRMPKNGKFMHYKVINGDTVYVDVLTPSYVFANGKMSQKEWKKYYKLVHNFSKAYPYALEARKTVERVDSTLGDGKHNRKHQKNKYINSIQKEIFEKYEPVIRDMTVSQGKLLIILIGRETGYTPYEIIHDYKNGAAAGFWQGIAKLFGGDLKREYDPEGADRATEKLVEKWNKGEFPQLYYSIFGKYPYAKDEKGNYQTTPPPSNKKKSLFDKIRSKRT